MWRYDGQQQDSSEFLLALDLSTGEHLDGGGPLILLPAPDSHTRLQALITSWHTEQLDVALTGTQPFAVLQVARFAEGSKLCTSSYIPPPSPNTSGSIAVGKSTIPVAWRFSLAFG